MKIAYVCCDFGVPVFGFKGASVHCREMIEAYRRAGHSVSLFSPAIDMEARDGENRFSDVPGLPPIELRPIGADPHHRELFVDFEKLDKFLGMKTRIRQEVRNLFYNMTIYEAAIDELRRASVDFVYERYTLAATAGNRLARDLGVPHILEVNAPLAYEQEKMRGLEMKDLARQLERRIYCEADRLVVVSSNLKKYAISCGVPEDSIDVVPNSVDPSRFQITEEERGAARARYGLEGRCVIGFVGGLKPWHGTETLLQALHKMRNDAPDSHGLIVGDGPAREELEAYVRDNGMQEHVTFTGKVPYRAIPTLLAAMDITVAPYTPNENFYFSPIKIFEYMMANRPTVAGSIGQVSEVLVDGETGRLYEPGNVDELAAVLTGLVNDPAARAHIGESGRAWVERERTWDRNAQHVIGIAKQLTR